MGVIQREMDRSYWDGMAKGYEDEIFSVLHNDRQGLIRDHIRRISSPQNKLVADVGCGIGHCLALLADHFKHVYAIDISRKLLKRARQSHGHRANIDFHGGDIVSVFRKLPAVDCVVSVNSLISSSGPVRERMLKAIARCLKPQGHLVLVVPSLESALLVDQRFAQWKRRLGTSHAAILHSVYPARPLADNKARQGIIPVDGVATKHYLLEELRFLLADRGLDVDSTARIEYGWDTEFESPPRWMQKPYAWDWLVVARRRKKK